SCRDRVPTYHRVCRGHWTRNRTTTGGARLLPWPLSSILGAFHCVWLGSKPLQWPTIVALWAYRTIVCRWPCGNTKRQFAYSNVSSEFSWARSARNDARQRRALWSAYRGGSARNPPCRGRIISCGLYAFMGGWGCCCKSHGSSQTAFIHAAPV